MKLAKILCLPPLALVLLFVSAEGSSVYAKTTSYLVTEEFIADTSRSSGQGYVFFHKSIPIEFQPGFRVYLSGRPDGTGEMYVGDSISVTNFTSSGASGTFTYPLVGNPPRFDTQQCVKAKPLDPVDLTSYVKTGSNSLMVRLTDWCINKNNYISDLFIVVTDEVPPTPFLDLPWDYFGKGMDFNEAANAIGSFFDHEYPLVSGGVEPVEAAGTVVKFEGEESRDPYSSHDGYDYGSLAKTKFGTSVLTSSSGWATYGVHTKVIKDSSGNDQTIIVGGGHQIKIDHGNGFQSRYYHLQPEGLITKKIGEKVWVEKGQQIGLVGISGNVHPKNISGAHIHFMVVADRDHDGDFEDDIPNGVVDPYGWQSLEQDPWEVYGGPKSYYLWSRKIEGLKDYIPANGGIFALQNFTFTFPFDSTRSPLMIELEFSSQRPAGSVGASIRVVTRDKDGNIVSSFSKPFTLSVDFSKADLSRFKPETLGLYSSSDGVNWQKEEAIIDFLNKKVLSQMDHLTYFVLAAERVDSTPPSTSLVLDGQKADDKFESVQLLLSAADQGSGVAYTAYKVGEAGWEEYKSPLTFGSKGSYVVEYYSEDNHGNVESSKKVEFSINPEGESEYFDEQPISSTGEVDTATGPVLGSKKSASAGSDDSDDAFLSSETSGDSQVKGFQAEGAGGSGGNKSGGASLGGAPVDFKLVALGIAGTLGVAFFFRSQLTELAKKFLKR